MGNKRPKKFWKRWHIGKRGNIVSIGTIGGQRVYTARWMEMVAQEEPQMLRDLAWMLRYRADHAAWPTPQRVFAVGDRVKVVELAIGCHSAFYVGSTATVVGITRHGLLRLSPDHADAHSGHSFLPKRVIPIAEAYPLAKDYKPGDLVGPKLAPHKIATIVGYSGDGYLLRVNGSGWDYSRDGEYSFSVWYDRDLLPYTPPDVTPWPVEANR